MLNESGTDRTQKQPVKENGKQGLAGWLFGAAMVIALLVAMIVRFDFQSFSQIDVSAMKDNDGSVLFCIDSAENSGGTLFITGWSVQPEVTLGTVNCSVALQSLSSGEFYQVQTTMIYREGLSAALGTPANVDNGGFQARLDIGKLKENETYVVFLLYRNNSENILVNTGVHIDSQGGRLQ